MTALRDMQRTPAPRRRTWQERQVLAKAAAMRAKLGLPPVDALPQAEVRS